MTTREYNPTTGALVGGVSSVNFGKIAAGAHTLVKVFDFAFSGVASVSNLKIGITSSTLEVNTTPVDITADQSSSNGKFGVVHTDTFDVAIASGNLGRHFAGKNTTGLSTSTNNVLIGNRSDTVSQFVYLNIELGANDLGIGSGAYKVFFDFT